jgi:F0F1-type ATP synthase membrane subunit a
LLKFYEALYIIIVLLRTTCKKLLIFLVQTAWQKIIESVSELSSQLISDIITTDNEKYFPFISVLFNFILFSNLIGLIPYSFTATSHLIVTFTFHFLFLLVLIL